MLRKIMCITISLLILNVSGMAKEDENIKDENINTEITIIYISFGLDTIKSKETKEISSKYSIDLRGGVGGRGGGRIGGGRIGGTSGGKISPKTYSSPKSPKVPTGTKSSEIKSSGIKEPISIRDKYSDWRYRPSPMLPPPRRFYTNDEIYSSFFSWQPRLFPNYLFGNNYYYNNTNRTW